MNILLSSYSFGVYRGSEADVGWDVARGLPLRGHMVVVITTYELTGSNHRTIKEEGLNIRLLEEDCGITDYPSASSYRKRQKGIGAAIKKEIIGNKYDVMHHVTFNHYRNIHDAFAAELPYLIEPVEGAEKIPFPLMLYGDLPLKMSMKEMLTKTTSLNEDAPYILFDGCLARPQKCTRSALRALRRLWDAGKLIPLRMVGGRRKMLPPFAKMCREYPLLMRLLSWKHMGTATACSHLCSRLSLCSLVYTTIAAA